METRCQQCTEDLLIEKKKRKRAWNKLEDNGDDYDDRNKTEANCEGALIMVMDDDAR